MTLEEVKNEMLFRTEQYIEEMKVRKSQLPTQRRAFSRLYDQLTDEILDFGIRQLPQIIDRNHLRYDLQAAIAFAERDLFMLAARVPEILFANTGDAEHNELLKKNAEVFNVGGQPEPGVTQYEYLPGGSSLQLTAGRRFSGNYNAPTLRRSSFSKAFQLLFKRISPFAKRRK